jgi:hypothetical protein
VDNLLSNILFHLRLRRIKRKGERYKREKRIRDAYAQYWPEKNKKKVSNIVLAVSICTIIIYTAASFWITYIRGISMDPTLTTCVYSFFGGELLMIAGIRVSKVIKNTVDSTIIESENNNNDAVG